MIVSDKRLDFSCQSCSRCRSALAYDRATKWVGLVGEDEGLFMFSDERKMEKLHTMLFSRLFCTGFTHPNRATYPTYSVYPTGVSTPTCKKSQAVIKSQ